MSLVDIRRACMAYLARREHSRFELKEKLLRKHFDAHEVDQVLDEFHDKKLQSDERFCDAYTRMRLRLGFGPERIRMELEQKKIADELIGYCLDQYHDEFYEAARAAWQKKFKQVASDYKEKAKQQRFLQYRGFTHDMIRQIIAM